MIKLTQEEEKIVEELKNAHAGDIVWALPENNTSQSVDNLPQQFLSKKDNSSNKLSLEVKDEEHKEEKKHHSDPNIKRTIKVDADKVDAILDLIGELVVTKSQLLDDEIIEKIGDQRISGLFFQLDKNIRELQERSLSLRMTTLHSIFLKLQRTIRDLSEKLGKPIDVIFQGDETEIDRSMVDALNDPLMHLCRNSLDHGIEETSVRIAKQKPAKGMIAITAGHKGGKIFIDVVDDGCGINSEEVFNKAKEQKLIPSNAELSDYAPHEIFELIFNHGFSTNAIANSISGRGVGLEIVKNNIQLIKGSIEVDSRKDEGTRFRLWIPLTTTITDAMLVRHADATFAIPVEAIRELMQPQECEISSTSDTREVVNVRGTLIPLIRLQDHLEQNNSNSTSVSPNNKIVIVIEENELQVGIMVDAVLGQSQVVVKGLSSALPNTKGIAGAAILGDGKVGLVLDIADLLEQFRNKNSSTFLEFAKGT